MQRKKEERNEVAQFEMILGANMELKIFGGKLYEE